MLMPYTAFEEVFAPLSGKQVCLGKAYGNVGDDLILAATLQLCAYYDVKLVPREYADLFAWPGGGNLGSMYACESDRRLLLYRQAQEYDRPWMILPQSWTSGDPTVLRRLNRPPLAIWCRETWSLLMVDGSKLAPDLALAFQPPWPAPPVEQEHGLFLRADAEANGSSPDSLGDPTTGCGRMVRLYWEKACRFGTVETNRLHFAILAKLAGRRVILRPSRTPKLQAMYDTWLKKLGFEWRD